MSIVYFPKQVISRLIDKQPCHSLQPGRSASKRGVGVQFGPDVTEEFCKNNDLGEFSSDQIT